VLVVVGQVVDLYDRLGWFGEQAGLSTVLAGS